MILFAGIWRSVAVLGLVSLGWSGCLPVGNESAEAEERSYLRKAEERKRALDYEGAAEAYESALRVNPGSAKAHFELGLLYNEELDNPAAAIYHFQNFMELAPDSPQIDMFVRPTITTCKRELAKNVAFAPVTQQMQEELKRLNEENQALQAKIDELRGELKKARKGGRRDEGTPPAARPQGEASESTLASNEEEPTSRLASTDSSSGGSEANEHTVRSDETMFSIAQRYGISVERLRQANPGIHPRKMTVGQQLKIPNR